MELNKEISNYLNGGYFPCAGSELGKLRKKLFSLSSCDINNIEKMYEKFYKKSKVKCKSTIKNIKPLKEISDSNFLQPLREFKSYVNKNFTEKEIFGVYLHGSLATRDYINNYSDFDALIILKKDMLASKKSLKKIKKKIVKANSFLYLLDPLQHHNLFIITEYDLNYYFEPIFPLELFKYAREVTNLNKNLNFRCLDESDYLKKEFYTRINFFKRPKKYNLHRLQNYHLKNAVQNILILPTIYLQLKNKKYYYKKDSFNVAKKDFSKEVWKIVAQCSNVREKCPYNSYYPYLFRKFISFKLHYKFLKFLHIYCDRDNSKCIINIIGYNFLEKAKTLITKMEHKIEDGF